MPDVYAAKPALVTGSIYRAPAGTTLPTDATTALAAAFKSLGYISEDGLTNGVSLDSSDTKSWGGVTVLSMITGAKETFKFKCLEPTNLEVLKTIYGSSNVTGSTLSSGVTVKAKEFSNDDAVWAIDMKLGTTLKRIVIPNGKITDMGEIVYKDSEAIGYELTISANADSTGVTHYEYIKTPTP